MRLPIAVLALLLSPFLAPFPALFPAFAETINVQVQRPAAANDVYMLQTMSVGRFAGTDGRAFATALERALERLRDPDGQPLFAMYEAGAAEAAASGRAEIDLVEGKYTEKRLLCPMSNDPNAKCEKGTKELVEVNCRSRLLTLQADIRISRESDGRILFNRSVPRRTESRWCSGDRNPPETQDAIAAMLRNAAEEAVRDFVPYSQLTPIRIREGRKGLSKEIGARFKAAVEATRGDGADGCQMFEDLMRDAETHVPLIFNLALCAEASGDFEGAAAVYRRIGDGEAMAAAERAVATQAAIKQAKQRREP